VEHDLIAKQGQSYLELAASTGALRSCQELVKHGAQVNAQNGSYNGSALATVSYMGKHEIVEFLVKEGADVNMQLQYGDYGSALAAASHMGEQEIVKFLVNGGADVNMQLQYDEYGSALAKAISSWQHDDEVVPTIRLLVNELGAEVNMQLQYGKYANALDAAEKRGAAGRVQLLIELGAEKEERRSKVVEESENDETEICD
jgi:hypothetical protein